MAKTRDAICGLANTWLGRNEREGTHKEIIDIYNSFAPAIARNYRVKYTDSWCATFISALAIKLGYTGIIPLECSCYYMIEKAKKMGIWYEVDNYHPCNGDIIMYDWQDSGEGDNKGVPDHVGLVVSVNPKDPTLAPQLGKTHRHREIGDFFSCLTWRAIPGLFSKLHRRLYSL